MFSAQLNDNQSQDERALSAPSPTIFLPKSTGKEVREIKLESRTRQNLAQIVANNFNRRAENYTMGALLGKTLQYQVQKLENIQTL